MAMIEAGERAAEQALPRIRDVAGHRGFGFASPFSLMRHNFSLCSAQRGK